MENTLSLLGEGLHGSFRLGASPCWGLFTVGSVGTLSHAVVGEILKVGA